MPEATGDISRTRSEEQRAAYATTVGKGKCPFCGPTAEMPEEIRSRMLIEGVYWRAWYNPHPYSGHATHLVLAPIQHWTQPGEIFVKAAAEWMAINTLLIEQLNLPGGGIVMRFGDHEHKGGSIAHLQSHIQVPDRKTFALAVLFADSHLLEFLELQKYMGKGKLHMGASSIEALVESGQVQRRNPTDRTYYVYPKTSQKQRALYPSNKRILEMAELHFPEHVSPEVIHRSPKDSQVIIRVGTGTTRSQREKFVRDLAKETIFPPS